MFNYFFSVRERALFYKSCNLIGSESGQYSPHPARSRLNRFFSQTFVRFQEKIKMKKIKNNKIIKKIKNKKERIKEGSEPLLSRRHVNTLKIARVDVSQVYVQYGRTELSYDGSI